MSKTALITGASRGIGRAIAYKFASQGYDLILTCEKSEALLRDLSDELYMTYGINCSYFVGDLSDASSCSALFNSVKSLDVLINNAGISYVGLLSDMTDADWDRVMGVNLNAPFYLSRLAIPLFLSKHEGKIINVTSVWGEAGASMEVAYSASKGGLIAFTKALAKELAPSNIAVNAVSLGMMDTDMNAHLSEEEKQDIIDDIPANRIGDPMEAAELILKVAESPNYMTGQIIRFDGAWI